MKQFSNMLRLSFNSRGLAVLDTSVGCREGTVSDTKGCYNDCYAANIAARYGYDFSETVQRTEMQKNLGAKIAKLPSMGYKFLRIGSMGDPSSNWGHCLSVIKRLNISMPIVIITKHWHKMTDKQLSEMPSNVTINTSVSAFDSAAQRLHRLSEHKRLGKSSVLRIVTAKFNRENEQGEFMDDVQKSLIAQCRYIDTAFRPTANNKYLRDGIISAKTENFGKGKMLVSKLNSDVFLGGCANCIDQCGARIT
jgi:hypothetical protein